MKNLTRTMSLIFVGVLLAISAGGVLQLHSALAAPPSLTVPTGSTTLETIPCNAGVSPCTVSNVDVTVLNANSSRMQCLLQNINTTDLYCLQGTTAASVTAQHFTLKAASAANKGDGGTFSCNSGPAIWRGALHCVGSGVLAAPSLNVSGASAAGF
jgi:hypothetical protein